MSTTREQSLPVSAHASPASTGPVPSPAQYYRANYPDLLGSPPIPPPRTSSTHHSLCNPSANSAASSTERGTGSRRAKSRRTDGNERGGADWVASHRERTLDRAPETGKPARQHPPLVEEEPARIEKEHPAGSRADGSSNHTNLMKEPSTVISQVLVSDPAVDLERERVRQAGAHAVSGTDNGSGSTSTVVRSDVVENSRRGGARSRHDRSVNSGKRKETTFGSYILGQTLGEGEFGKVKLGWKKDGSVQVAIKLIRRESLGSNPSRLPKIYREISILRDLSHPNIVRLHEMVETDRHIGIIMEYASGGELFDHILNNRYLKDNAARRLFAQLISGVGYLHKKGIVHRDLKLENLLLDRNRNIIITDFGFANTFDPTDELDEEIEYNLTNKEFVKRMQLDKVNSKGVRRGDLMQTSCGSPCYAAPELVVSDSLYTGRKVDVWSCGVILYAMLAGYLPFDDDPANPDGDNINLLYKYIVTTPLTFPEYVTPHARDLLRRILVPDPRKRADLFEVARHSWLSEYSHIVSNITSSTTKVSDIATTTVPSDVQDASSLARSASVREPPKTYHQTAIPPLGGLSHQAGDISKNSAGEKAKTPRDAKRRTVQLEYVAPQSQTVRGPPSRDMASGDYNSPTASGAPSTNLTAIFDPEHSLQHVPTESGSRVQSSKAPAATTDGYPTNSMPAHVPRSTTSDVVVTSEPQPSTRPTTGGSMASFNTGRLPSRGSYSQPVAPTVAATNAQGSLAQPKTKQYVISGPILHDSPDISIGRPSTQQLPGKYNSLPKQEFPKSHKRSSTVSGLSEKIFGRPGSIFSGRSSQAATLRPKSSSKRGPPPSMKFPFPADESRASLDSRRSGQYNNNRKMNETGGEKPRRFSLLPSSFAIKGLTREYMPEEEPQTAVTVGNQGGPTSSSASVRTRTRAINYATQDPVGQMYEGHVDDGIMQADPINYQTRIDEQFAALHGAQSDHYPPTSHDDASTEHVYQTDYDNSSNTRSFSQRSPVYPNSYKPTDNSLPRQSPQVGLSGRGPAVLQKNYRKFADAYETERSSHHSGSSGAARKVMDFFRRRAKSRTGDDR